MKNKGKFRLTVTDEEFQEKIYDGILGGKELNKTMKKIKRKFI